jgi:hypothetical protein
MASKRVMPVYSTPVSRFSRSKVRTALSQAPRASCQSSRSGVSISRRNASSSAKRASSNLDAVPPRRSCDNVCAPRELIARHPKATALRLLRARSRCHPNPSQDREVPDCPLPNRVANDFPKLAHFPGRKRSPARNFMVRVCWRGSHRSRCLEPGARSRGVSIRARAARLSPPGEHAPNS